MLNIQSNILPSVETYVSPEQKEKNPFSILSYNVEGVIISFLNPESTTQFSQVSKWQNKRVKEFWDRSLDNLNNGKITLENLKINSLDQIKDRIGVKNCSKLLRLDLSQMEKQDLKDLKFFNKLETLILNTRYASDDFKVLIDFPNIKNLYFINKNPDFSTKPNRFINLCNTNIEKLYIFGCDTFSFIRFYENKNIKKIKVKDSGVKIFLCTNSKKLEKLIFKNCPNFNHLDVNKAKIKKINIELKTLKIVELSKCNLENLDLNCFDGCPLEQAVYTDSLLKKPS